ncbi:Aspartic peptidase [Gossypium australe]|uniref:Aspartic peptidase n=1 Tax=Gossypium australe TaxID=47621 RepID=A0A5B6X097_9ROSI|nr:Aspartic peptidase [Gossypium australe]
MLRNFKNQVGQLATGHQNRPQGALPSNTENLRVLGKEYSKTVPLRSGKMLEPKVAEVKYKPADKEEVQLRVETPAPQKPNPKKSNKVNYKPVRSDKLTPFSNEETLPRKDYPIQAKVPPPPYPQRFKQQQDTPFKAILDGKVTSNDFNAIKSQM